MTQEFKETNMVRKKSQLKKVRRKVNLGLLARKMVIIHELCIVIGSFPRTTHTDFLVATVCSLLLSLFSCLSVSIVSSVFLFHNIIYAVLSSSVFHMSPHFTEDDSPVWKLHPQLTASFPVQHNNYFKVFQHICTTIKMQAARFSGN